MTELQQQGAMDDRRTNRDTTPPKPSPLLKDATPPPENLPAIPESPKTPKSPQVGRGRGEREREGQGERARAQSKQVRRRKKSKVTVSQPESQFRESLRAQYYFFISLIHQEGIVLHRQDLPRRERATRTQRQCPWLATSTCSMDTRRAKWLGNWQTCK